MFPHFCSKFIRSDEEVVALDASEVRYSSKSIQLNSSQSRDGNGTTDRLRAREDLPRMGSALRQLDLENLNREPGPPTELRNRKDKLARFEKECSRVGERLFVGGEVVAKSLEVLHASNITHIVNCVGFLYPAYFDDEFRYRTLYLQDSPKEDILSVLYDVFDFIEEARNVGNVFIHCSQGVSRSTSLAIAYRMWCEKKTYEEVFAEVKELRGVANPNIGFICQLMQWHKRRTEEYDSVKLYRIAPQSYSAPKYLVAKWIAGTEKVPLDPRGVFILHAPRRVFLWEGNGTSDEFVMAGYRFANQLRKYEVQESSEHLDVVKVAQEKETDEFMKYASICSNIERPDDSNLLEVKRCRAFDSDFELWHRSSFSSKASDILSDSCDSARNGRKTPRNESRHAASPNDRLRKQARSEIKDGGKTSSRADKLSLTKPESEAPPESPIQLRLSSREEIFTCTNPIVQAEACDSQSSEQDVSSSSSGSSTLSDSDDEDRKVARVPKLNFQN